VKKLLLATVAMLACAEARADGPPGQWMDVRNRIALGAMPEDSEPIARLLYAKALCRAKTGQVAGEMPTRADFACLKAEGFVWVYDTPAQVAARTAARQRAADAETMRVVGAAVGQAFRQAGEAMSPPGCSGHVQPGGYFNMQCY
jgi:hypothetical protein